MKRGQPHVHSENIHNILGVVKINYDRIENRFSKTIK